MGSAERAANRARAALRGDETMLMAEDGDGTLIGSASVRWLCDCDPLNPWLYGVCIVPSARRGGVGRALIAACEAEARQRGYSYLSLDVDVGDERVIGLYRRLGYVVVRRHDHITAVGHRLRRS